MADTKLCSFIVPETQEPCGGTHINWTQEGNEWIGTIHADFVPKLCSFIGPRSKKQCITAHRTWYETGKDVYIGPHGAIRVASASPAPQPKSPQPTQVPAQPKRVKPTTLLIGPSPARVVQNIGLIYDIWLLVFAALDMDDFLRVARTCFDWYTMWLDVRDNIMFDTSSMKGSMGISRSPTLRRIGCDASYHKRMLHPALMRRTNLVEFRGWFDSSGDHMTVCNTILSQNKDLSSFSITTNSGGDKWDLNTLTLVDSRITHLTLPTTQVAKLLPQLPRLARFICESDVIDLRALENAHPALKMVSGEYIRGEFPKSLRYVERLDLCYINLADLDAFHLLIRDSPKMRHVSFDFVNRDPLTLQGLADRACDVLLGCGQITITTVAENCGRWNMFIQRPGADPIAVPKDQVVLAQSP